MPDPRYHPIPYLLAFAALAGAVLVVLDAQDLRRLAVRLSPHMVGR